MLAIEKVNTLCQNLTLEELQNPSNNWLEAIYNVETTFEGQIPLVMTAARVHPSTYKHFLECCTTLETVAKQCYPNCTVYARPFGSSATRLACKGGRLDVYLDFDPLPAQHLEILNKLREALKNKKDVFSVVYCVFARHLKCTHVSGVCSHVTITNSSLDVIQSDLLRFFLDFDERVEPFLLLLKFWMKKQNLSGPSTITTASLVILGIFFLQLEEISVLPSIFYLQTKSIATNIIDDWDVSFIQDKTIIPPSGNDMTVFHLLEGFFSYYAQFEFGIHVVCPFLGRAILKPLFSKLELLPQDLHYYKINVKQNPSRTFDISCAMCVQEVFCHSENTTQNVSVESLQFFQDSCARASAVCEEEAKRQESNLPSQFFKQLLKPHDRDLFEENNSIRINLGENLLCDGTYDEDYLGTLWYTTVRTLLIQILTKVMRCSVTVDSTSDSGYGYNYDNDNEADGDTETRTIRCVMDYDLLVIKLRDNAWEVFEFPEAMFIMEKEELVSDYLFDNYFKDKEKLGLKFNVYFVYKKRPTHVVFKFVNLETDHSRKIILDQLFSDCGTTIPTLIAKALDNLKKIVK